ncbi:hypothetical protein I3843_15G042800 [Carya illinoinensis]|uniref:Cytochrome P450 n=1 Tax=Carya illinoinensis TaxID=32201 RepID=A0A8T1NBU6_CARIL|nr:cytochrome P450 81Q32-like [Carya illinoinensis]KAG6626437.1 hypothetical protein CIPAW_15G047900 [Carya illinoinensis]KAG7943500.1 hypothetical protein I3843_15G042800 [Carya illinoinensis]
MIIFCQVLLLVAFYVIAKHLLSKTQNLPPSPFPTLPIVGHLYLLKKPLHRTLTRLSNRYGPIIYLSFGSRPVLVVSSPCAAEECLATKDIIFANRPRLLAGKHLGYNFTSLGSASYGDHWRNLRRISSLELLSSHRLQTLSHIRTDEVRSLLRRLLPTNNKNQNQTQVHDLKSAFFELTLNVMMRMISGKRYYGGSTAEAEEDQVCKFRDIVSETFRLGSVTNVADFLPMLSWFGISGIEKSLIVLKEKRDRFMQSLIEEHRRMGCDADAEKGKKKKKTMIGVLLDLQESEPEYYKDEIIKGIMLELLSAGTDTSAGTMEWAMSLLLNNPDVLKKAQVEIDNHVGLDRLLDQPDLAELPYLHCIINETLRMYPAGPLLVPHESSEDCQVGGFQVPGGTTLLVNLWGMQNDPTIWEDPTNFKPERFEGFGGMKDEFKFRFMPFGTGRRSCPGEGLAIRMVGFALGSLIQCFEWQRIDEGMVDMSEVVGLTLTKARPLHAICQARPAMVNLLSQL